jgi:hypothetical protein
MRLPWWVWLAYANVKFWFVSIPAAIVLSVIDWYGGHWFGGLRWVLLAAVAALILPFPAAAAIVLFQKIDATRYWRTLVHPEAIAGLSLPTGSKLRFADKAQSILLSIELPHVTEIAGMRLTGTLARWRTWGDVGPVWGGILAENQHLDGMPCRAGRYSFDKFGGVLFDDAGIIHRCTLAAAHDLLGLKLPRDTAVWRGDDRKDWKFLLPANAGVEIQAIATTAPPGVTLSVANDGRLRRIGAGHGQTIVVCGTPLNSKRFELQGQQVVSELAAPHTVAGAIRPVGTAVRIDLATGNLAVAVK